MASQTDTRITDTPAKTSLWLTQVTRWLLCGLLGIGVASLLLAMVGLMRPWLALPLGAALSVAVGRFIPVEREDPVPPAVAGGVAAIVLVIAIFGISSPHEHVLANRDSGTYVSTAAWVAETGTLRMEVGSPLLDGLPVEFGSLGFPAVTGDTTLTPQFLHLFPSTLALIGSLSPDPIVIYGMSPVVAAIGLLAFFAFARRLIPDRMALLATALVATTMPFLYFSRAPFTEAMAFAFVSGGLWMASRALRNQSLTTATGAGLLFGGLMLTRIDGVVVLFGLFAYRSLTQLRATPMKDGSEKRQTAVMDRMVGVAAALFILAMVDGALFAPQYLSDHGTLTALVLGAILIVAIVGRVRRVAEGFNRYQGVIANVTAGVVALFLVYAGTVRPLVESPTRSDIYGIAGLQRAAEVAVEPLRSYAELSVQWLTWYLGVPLVLLGLAGLVYFLRRALLGMDEGSGLFVVLASAVTVVYVYRPSINPDHIWAMRRFVPVILPALVVFAAMGLALILARTGRWSPIVATAAVIAFAAPVVLTTLRGGLAAEFEGASTDLAAGCEELQTGSTVIFVGEASGIRSDALAPPIRGICEATVATEDPADPLVASELRQLAATAAEQGTSVWVIGELDGVETQGATMLEASYEYLELTLFEAPDQWLDLDLNVTARRVVE